jgi:hypothetical protein
MCDEPEEVRCDECELRFYIVASRDAEIAAGFPFYCYCPRCGEPLEQPDA